MNTSFQMRLGRKALYAAILLSLVFSLCSASGSPAARAQEVETNTPTPTTFLTETPTKTVYPTQTPIETLEQSEISTLTETETPIQLFSLSATCDPQVYYGVQHCTDGTGTHFIIVNLNDSHVRFQTVLSSGPNGECNSVNHNGKDPGSNCPNPYPFEKMSSMLSRYKSQGAVAVINTDYFGPGGDHGAEGLAVRNGSRLDGITHGDSDGNSLNRPSLAISPAKSISIGTPGSENEIDSNLSGKYFNTVGGWPIIVSNGQTVNTNCSTCASSAQSAVGITSDGRLILITATKNASSMASYLINNFGVRTALKFDGGGSARLAWLDSNGNIHSWGVTGEDRAVAEGLLVFSEKIGDNPPPPPPPTGNWTANYYDTVDRWWDTNNSGNYKCSETINGPTLDKNYGSSAPCSGMDGDTWVGDYTAKINFPSGNYVFRVEHDDGLKLWVNNQNIADRSSSGADWMCPARSLSGDTNLHVILREDGGDAKVKVSWTTDTSACVTDGATFITQSAYPTVNPGQSFQIFFEVKNTGTSTWQPGSYWLQNLQYPLGANTQQSLSQSVPPNGTYRWTINQTAPSNLGTYRSQWMISHNGTTFGPNMYIDVTVQCVPSSVPPKSTLVFPPNGGSVNTLTPTLDWTDVSSNYCVDYYNIQVYEDGGGQIVMDWPRNSEYTIPSGKMAWGKKYSWYVWAHNALGFGDGFGASFEVVSPPPNDDFNTPKIISTMPYSDSLDTREATQASDDPALTACNRAPGQATVWYKYVPSDSGQIRVDTIGSDYDTMLAVWSGTRGNLSLVSCNDDRVSDLQSELTVNVIAGTTYYIEVAQFEGYLATSLAIQPQDKLGANSDLGILSGGSLKFNFHFYIPFYIYLPLVIR